MAKSKNQLKLTEAQIRIRLDQYAAMTHEEKLDVWNVLYVKFNNMAAEAGCPFDEELMTGFIDDYERVLLEAEKYEVLAILRDFRQFHEL